MIDKHFNIFRKLKAKYRYICCDENKIIHYNSFEVVRPIIINSSHNLELYITYISLLYTKIKVVINLIVF